MRKSSPLVYNKNKYTLCLDWFWGWGPDGLETQYEYYKTPKEIIDRVEVIMNSESKLFLKGVTIKTPNEMYYKSIEAFKEVLSND